MFLPAWSWKEENLYLEPYLEPHSILYILHFIYYNYIIYSILYFQYYIVSKTMETKKNSLWRLTILLCDFLRWIFRT